MRFLPSKTRFLTHDACFHACRACSHRVESLSRAHVHAKNMHAQHAGMFRSKVRRSFYALAHKMRAHFGQKWLKKGCFGPPKRGSEITPPGGVILGSSGAKTPFRNPTSLPPLSWRFSGENRLFRAFSSKKPDKMAISGPSPRKCGFIGKNPSKTGPRNSFPRGPRAFRVPRGE